MRLHNALATLAVLALVPACSPGDSGGVGEEHEGDSGNAIKVCADGATVRGVDVSYYQGNTSKAIWDSGTAGH